MPHCLLKFAITSSWVFCKRLHFALQLICLSVVVAFKKSKIHLNVTSVTSISRTSLGSKGHRPTSEGYIMLGHNYQMKGRKTSNLVEEHHWSRSILVLIKHRHKMYQLLTNGLTYLQYATSFVYINYS